MTIAEWLESPNPTYHTGLLLFKQFGNNASMLSLFQSGENSFTRTKLREALIAIKNTSPQGLKVSVKEPVKPEPTKPQEQTDKSPIADTVRIKNVSFKEMAALHQQLPLLPTDAKRYEAACRIYELDTIVAQCWATIDYFNEHGHLPPSDDDMALKTIGDVVRLAKNVPTYISKLNAKLKDPKLSEEQTTELDNKKAQWQILLLKIEELMHEPIRV